MPASQPATKFLACIAPVAPPTQPTSQQLGDVIGHLAGPEYVCGVALKSLGRCGPPSNVVKIGLAVAKQVGRAQDASAPARRSFGDVSMARPTDSHGRTECDSATQVRRPVASY